MVEEAIKPEKGEESYELRLVSSTWCPLEAIATAPFSLANRDDVSDNPTALGGLKEGG